MHIPCLPSTIPVHLIIVPVVPIRHVRIVDYALQAPRDTFQCGNLLREGLDEDYDYVMVWPVGELFGKAVHAAVGDEVEGVGEAGGYEVFDLGSINGEEEDPVVGRWGFAIVVSVWVIERRHGLHPLVYPTVPVSIGIRSIEQLLIDISNDLIRHNLWILLEDPLVFGVFRVLRSVGLPFRDHHRVKVVVVGEVVHLVRYVISDQKDGLVVRDCVGDRGQLTAAVVLVGSVLGVFEVLAGVDECVVELLEDQVDRLVGGGVPVKYIVNPLTSVHSAILETQARSSGLDKFWALDHHSFGCFGEHVFKNKGSLQDLWLIQNYCWSSCIVLDPQGRLCPPIRRRTHPRPLVVHFYTILYPALIVNGIQHG